MSPTGVPFISPGDVSAGTREIHPMAAIQALVLRGTLILPPAQQAKQGPSPGRQIGAKIVWGRGADRSNIQQRCGALLASDKEK